jgi:hypothetical protein
MSVLEDVHGVRLLGICGITGMLVSCLGKGDPHRRKQGPIQFLENNPIQSSFRVRFMCPKTRRNWLRLPIVRFHPGSSCPNGCEIVLSKPIGSGLFR